ncbi:MULTISPECIES: toll/interleukin-1 receptor domain-containing protein [unclassified Rhodanobacter]|uniref:toll/interleukin-1 receptor domain-containing protein n=1 Tax=unclassified Rhodanobacter TaxID=2621553 RepID=UPI001BE126B3|nr:MULTISPECIES: toll/interleukin-1 receptor domain-containing protein [unclassified Rhodanobacter]MBT2144665.1 TIR domain-containing protein [Rhodanobacter sp. LX-99]MBT2148710.1 TIR domain-containing protein [Rhodanobacter sp. LX-100]
MTQASAVPACRYRAFISYSHRDKAWAGWLHRALETYAVPKRLVGQATAFGEIPARLAPIFRDRDELASATDLGRKVNEALAQSASLLVICSPNSATSHWVNEEVLAFKRLGRSERIFCLIVDGEPDASELPGRAAEECFAPALRHRLGADGALGHERTEPIAADARAGKDGKANAKLKLIAGMLDIGFDALKRRELQRRARRMAALATLALIVMAATTALAITAMIARHAAVVASQAAERRQKQAEGLVNFMLGDLNDKLAQVSRLDIMETVDDHSMSYFQSLPSTDVTDEALAQRAKALEKIGSVRLDQGHLPAAMASYQAASKLAAMLAEKAPADSTRQLAYAQVLAFVGMTHWYQGQLDAAQQSFESAQTVLQRAVPSEADVLPLQYQQEMIENNIGHVLEARGRLDEATGHYRNALALSRKLVAARPGKTEWALELGGAHNNLGKLALMRGDLATAVAEYAADDAIEAALSARDPRNNDQRESMLTVRAILGRTLALTGDIEAGMRDLQQAVDIARQLTKIDPGNTSFQEHLALYSSQLGRLRRLSGDLPAAQALNGQSLSIFLALTKQDPANVGRQREFAEAQLEQAAQSQASGQTDAARRQAQAALTILAPLFVKQSDDRATLLATAGAQLLLAAVSDEVRAPRQLRSDALNAMQAVKSGGDDPRLLALQVEALLALGMKAQAQAVTRRLWGSGYRDAALLAVLRRERIDYPVNTAFQQKLLAATDINARQ